MTKPKIGIIIGTTRETRFGDKPAQWIFEIASERSDMDFEIVDLRDYPMPLFAEARSPAYGPPQDLAAQRWGRKLDELDGIIFITAEYSRSISGTLKNALDYAYEEFNKKPAAFVGYGGVGGARAVEQLRLMCIELQMAPLRSGVHITLDPFLQVMKGEKRLADFGYLNQGAATMLDELAWWTPVLKTAREEASRWSEPRLTAAQ